MIKPACLLLLYVLLPLSLQAMELRLPTGARTLDYDERGLDSYALPVGAFAEGHLPVLQVQGKVVRQSWRIGSQGLTSLQVMTPLRAQLEEIGFEVLFACDTRSCGGFDFRFETEVMAAPSMHVDLSDFRFLAARRGAEEHLSLLVSRSSGAGFVQMIRVTKGDTPELKIADTTEPQTSTLPDPQQTGDLIVDLVGQGHVILSDLEFKTGSSTLGEGPFDSLTGLASFLKADPDLRLALVGHTDAVGNLNNNIALSKKRARSVLNRLVSAHGVARSQLVAEGMGYLSPVAPNQSESGRSANRRVEAVLLNTK